MHVEWLQYWDSNIFCLSNNSFSCTIFSKNYWCVMIHIVHAKKQDKIRNKYFTTIYLFNSFCTFEYRRIFTFQRYYYAKIDISSHSSYKQIKTLKFEYFLTLYTLFFLKSILMSVHTLSLLCFYFHKHTLLYIVK
jgi:hypothetical protein